MKKKVEKDEVLKVGKLTQKQIRFCHEYLVDFNGTKAALRAGYEKSCARSQASKMLCNVVLKNYIDELLKEANLGPGETKKLISDIAKGSLNEYFVIRKVEHTPRVVKSLHTLIAELQEEIDFEEEFANEAGLTDEDYADHMVDQNKRRLQIVRYKVELRRNPKAARIVNGETTLIEVPELDMARLVKDKEAGKIKSVTPTQFGTKIEMYAADAALTNIARIHGLFEKDNSQTNINYNVEMTKEQVKQISKDLESEF